jgi:hypothetical protein
MMKKNSDFWVRPIKRLQGNFCNYDETPCMDCFLGTHKKDKKLMLYFNDQFVHIDVQVLY